MFFQRFRMFFQRCSMQWQCFQTFFFIDKISSWSSTQVDWSHWWLDINTLENVLWKYNFFSGTVMIPPYNSNINWKNDMNSQWKTKAFTFCSRSVQINLHRTLIFVTLRVFDVVSGCNMSRGNWEKHEITLLDFQIWK